MRYKVGDKVRIKSLDWYNKNIKNNGIIICGSESFTHPMSHFCDKVVTIVTIQDNCYRILEDDGDWYWTDEMIEGLAEEDVDLIPKFGEYSDNEPLDVPTLTTEFVKEYGLPCPDGYIFKDENGNIINAQKIVLEKKGSRYPKTYEECSIINGCEGRISLSIIGKFTRLINARNAYWRIAGKEMGLGKPWKPDWTIQKLPKYCIAGVEGQIKTAERYIVNTILAFPTEEMRDAFYEAFKKEIELVKELL